jgi:nucleoside diphosphate kinase
MSRYRPPIALFLVKHDALAQAEDAYARVRMSQEGLGIVHEQEVRFTEDMARAFYYDKEMIHAQWKPLNQEK